MSNEGWWRHPSHVRKVNAWNRIQYEKREAQWQKWDRIWDLFSSVGWGIGLALGFLVLSAFIVWLASWIVRAV